MAANTNAPLEVEIGVTLKKLTQQLAQAEARMVKTAKKMEKDFGAANKSVTTGFSAPNKAANNFAKGGLRNVSLQLSQVAQQGSATGNYLQALAIQLPDLALGFGTLGIAAGAVAGSLLPVIVNMIDAGDAAVDLDGALKSVKAITESMNAPLDVLSLSARELSERYGAAAGAVREFALVQAQIALGQANEALREQIPLLEDASDRYTTAADAGRDYRNALARIADDFGVTAEQAKILEAAMQAVELASDYDAQVAALRNMVDLMEAFGVKVSDLPPEFASALSEVITLSREVDAARVMADELAASAGNVDGAVSGAAESAAQLAQNMAAAATAMSRYNQQQSKQYSGRGGDPRDFMDGGSEAGYESAAGYVPVSNMLPTAARGKSSGGRSSGGSGISEQMRDAQRLFEATRTEAEQYAAELANVESLHAAGAISGDTYNRALSMLAEKYGEATSQGEGLREVTGLLEDAIIDFAMNGESAMDSLTDAIKRAALQAALFGEGPLSGLFGGGSGLVGNLVSSIPMPSFAGGGYTGGGSRSGGIDGRGGFPAVLHPNETVIDHTRGGTAGNSIVYSPTIDARGADQAAVARLAAVVAEDKRNFARNVQMVNKYSGVRGRG